MSYTVNLNNKTLTVEYGTLNTETSLELVGKDYFGYGEAIAQNFATLLENSAIKDDATGPDNPVTGQLWYQKTAGNLKVFDGENWSSTDVRDKKILANDGQTYHDVVIMEAAGNDGVLKNIAAFAKTAFTIHNSEPQWDASGNTDTPNLGVFPQNKIEAGLTLTADMMMHGTATTAQYADLAELYTCLLYTSPSPRD